MQLCIGKAITHPPGRNPPVFTEIEMASEDLNFEGKQGELRSRGLSPFLPLLPTPPFTCVASPTARWGRGRGREVSLTFAYIVFPPPPSPQPREGGREKPFLLCLRRLQRNEGGREGREEKERQPGDVINFGSLHPPKAGEGFANVDQLLVQALRLCGQKRAMQKR